MFSEQVPTIPCDMCEGSGTFGGDDCPGCEGEDALTPGHLDEKAKDFVDQFKGVQDQVQGRAPVDHPSPPEPGSLAAKVLQAGREADTFDRGGKLKPG